MIKKKVRCCDICQRSKGESISPPRLLGPLPMSEHVWEEISIDLVEGLPVSQRKSTIWVIVDRLSKFAYFISLKHPFSAAQLVKIFCKEIVKLYGIPVSITSE